MNEVKELVKKAIEELTREGLKPDIILVGPKFLEYWGDISEDCELKVYEIEELGYDAVVADSAYLGQIKRASRRISVEPFLEEREVWREIEKLEI
ncbi:family 4B encapsulin nanocompartment shell protein [Thermococcus sp.]